MINRDYVWECMKLSFESGCHLAVNTYYIIVLVATSSGLTLRHVCSHPYFLRVYESSPACNPCSRNDEVNHGVERLCFIGVPKFVYVGVSCGMESGKVITSAYLDDLGRQ